jgi:hypothetical protein
VELLHGFNRKAWHLFALEPDIAVIQNVRRGGITSPLLWLSGSIDGLQSSERPGIAVERILIAANEKDEISPQLDQMSINQQDVPRA